MLSIPAPKLPSELQPVPPLLQRSPSVRVALLRAMQNTAAFSGDLSYRRGSLSIELDETRVLRPGPHEAFSCETLFPFNLGLDWLRLLAWSRCIGQELSNETRRHCQGVAAVLESDKQSPDVFDGFGKIYRREWLCE